MAIKSIRIGSGDNIFQWDDGEFATAIETTEAIEVGGIITGGTLPAAVPVDADEMVFVDVSSADELSVVTITDFKAFLKTYFDTIYSPI